MLDWFMVQYFLDRALANQRVCQKGISRFYWRGEDGEQQGQLDKAV